MGEEGQFIFGGRPGSSSTISTSVARRESGLVERAAVVIAVTIALTYSHSLGTQRMVLGIDPAVHGVGLTGVTGLAVGCAPAFQLRSGRHEWLEDLANRFP